MTMSIGSVIYGVQVRHSKNPTLNKIYLKKKTRICTKKKMPGWAHLTHFPDPPYVCHSRVSWRGTKRFSLSTARNSLSLSLSLNKPEGVSWRRKTRNSSFIIQFVIQFYLGFLLEYVLCLHFSQMTLLEYVDILEKKYVLWLTVNYYIIS